MVHPLLRTDTGQLTVIAHRGASAVAPENTMPAFRAAWYAGCQWLEVDTQPDASGRPTLLHDTDLDRTTDGSGPIRDASPDYLATLDCGKWFGPAYDGTPIPTLAQLIAALPDDGRLLLEIKGAHTNSDLRQILALVEESPADDRILLQSIERDVLADLHRLVPRRPLGLLTEEWDDDPIAVCAAYGAIAYNPDFELLRSRRSALEDSHKAGIACAPWTTNDPADWAWLDKMGIDAIITDAPALLIDWLQHHAVRPVG